MIAFPTRRALLSRLIIITFQFVANRLFPDHNPGVFASPIDPALGRPLDTWIDYFLGGFRRWDAQYYLHIAEHGYSYENVMAFYPLFPGCIRFATKFVLFTLPLESLVSFRELALVLAVVMNVVFFVKAVAALQQITAATFNNSGMTKSAVFLFCINPASIFFTAPYTESLFAWLTFSLIGNCMAKRFKWAVVPLMLSICCRSNGLINLGFPVFYMGQAILAKRNVWTHMAELVLATILALGTFGLIQYYHFIMFCQENDLKHSTVVTNYGAEHNLVLAGAWNHTQSPWCLDRIPISYNYVQKQYWDVGFLNYYTPKQIPNFILAAPIIAIFTSTTFNYFRRQSRKSLKLLLQLILGVPDGTSSSSTTDCRLFVFMVHATVLTLLCLGFVHIQVSTRLLASASPCLYWFCRVDLDARMNAVEPGVVDGKHLQDHLILGWSMFYLLMGTFLFCNFLPWT